MKTLKTDITGKFPFVLDDLRWQFEGIKEVIAQICKPHGDKVILWGLEKEMSSNLITEGAAYINGEIYLGGGTPADEWYSDFTNVAIVETFDPAGLKEFPERAEGDRLKNTYSIKKLAFTSKGSLPEITGYHLESFTRLSGITDTIALTDELGYEDLRLDFQNGLLKRKWRFVETSGLLSLDQGIILPVIGSYADFTVTYVKGTNGANSWNLSIDYTDISLNITTGGEGTTTVRATRLSYPSGYFTTINLTESGNLLDYGKVATDQQGLD